MLELSTGLFPAASAARAVGTGQTSRFGRDDLGAMGGGAVRVRVDVVRIMSINRNMQD